MWKAALFVYLRMQVHTTVRLLKLIPYLFRWCHLHVHASTCDCWLGNVTWVYEIKLGPPGLNLLKQTKNKTLKTFGMLGMFRSQACLLGFGMWMLNNINPWPIAWTSFSCNLPAAYLQLTLTGPVHSQITAWAILEKKWINSMHVCLLKNSCVCTLQ